MKTEQLLLAIFYLIFIGFVSSCSEDGNLSDGSDGETGYSDEYSVSTLNSPDDNTEVVLKSGGETTFSWEAPAASDDVSVIYEVLFDNVDGNFSSTVYTSAPLEETSLIMNHSVLQSIYEGVGGSIEETDSVKLMWTVRTTVGNDEYLATETRNTTIKYEALDSAALAPKLIIKGDGAEEGQQFAVRPYLNIRDKAFDTSKGEVYEIFTKLSTTGKYYFEYTAYGDSSIYVVNGSDVFGNATNTIQEGTAEDATSIPYDGVYRIQITQNFSEIYIIKVNDMELFLPDYSSDGGWDHARIIMDYKEKGTWEVTSSLTFHEAPDEDYNGLYIYRFNYYVSLAEGGLEKGAIRHFGSIINQDADPNDYAPIIEGEQPELNEQGYMDLVDIVSNGAYGGVFRAPEDVIDKTEPYNTSRYSATVRVYLNAEDGYYHELLNIVDNGDE